MGGKFGEMSTFMNHTFQSFNFRLGNSTMHNSGLIRKPVQRVVAAD